MKSRWKAVAIGRKRVFSALEGRTAHYLPTVWWCVASSITPRVYLVCWDKPTKRKAQKSLFSEIVQQFSIPHTQRWIDVVAGCLIFVQPIVVLHLFFRFGSVRFLVFPCTKRWLGRKRPPWYRIFPEFNLGRVSIGSAFAGFELQMVVSLHKAKSCVRSIRLAAASTADEHSPPSPPPPKTRTVTLKIGKQSAGFPSKMCATFSPQAQQKGEKQNNGTIWW